MVALLTRRLLSTSSRHVTALLSAVQLLSALLRPSGSQEHPAGTSWLRPTPETRTSAQKLTDNSATRRRLQEAAERRSAGDAASQRPRGVASIQKLPPVGSAPICHEHGLFGGAFRKNKQEEDTTTVPHSLFESGAPAVGTVLPGSGSLGARAGAREFRPLSRKTPRLPAPNISALARRSCLRSPLGPRSPLSFPASQPARWRGSCGRLPSPRPCWGAGGSCPQGRSRCSWLQTRRRCERRASVASRAFPYILYTRHSEASGRCRRLRVDVSILERHRSVSRVAESQARLGKTSLHED